jgi:hypothetical protein
MLPSNDELCFFRTVAGVEVNVRRDDAAAKARRSAL